MAGNKNISQGNEQRRATARRGTGKFGPTTRTIEWDSLSCELVAELVSLVCDSGNGLVLGRTSDGGALSITIIDGEYADRTYPTTTAEFESAVLALRDLYKA